MLEGTTWLLSRFMVRSWLESADKVRSLWSKELDPTKLTFAMGTPQPARRHSAMKSAQVTPDIAWHSSIEWKTHLTRRGDDGFGEVSSFEMGQGTPKAV